MNISKCTIITMNKRNISLHKISPREDCSVEFQLPEGDISNKFNPFAIVDSFRLVKNVPRLQLSRHPIDDDDDDDDDDDTDDSELEFNDLEEVSEWFATYMQDITPATKRDSVVSLKAAAPVKRRSSVKHTAPLKEATKTSGGSRSNRLLNRNKRMAKQDIRKRVRDTLGRNSIQLNRDRLQCSKNAAKATL